MNKNISKQILEMKRLDQDARKDALKVQSNPSELTVFNYLVYVIDGVHNHRIHQLISKHGYPTKKLVGAKTLKAFWLLIQHQDMDTDLQNACLEQCDFEGTERAYLTDRLLVNAGKKQRFGTQFFRAAKNKKFNLRPLEDSKNVNKRRASVGLGTLEQYTKEFLEFHRKAQKDNAKSGK